MIERPVAYAVVVEALRESLAQGGVELPANVGEDTVLVGKDAVLDSLGVVSLIVEVEQSLDAKHGILVTLANDRAMSQRNSPFRTIGVLTDHVCAMAKEA